ncbi:hypothetical protein QYF36_020493 [Acer negundo]|nr:hypothetical protein QYF36_020493 [Acer negundo]
MSAIEKSRKSAFKACTIGGVVQGINCVKRALLSVRSFGESSTSNRYYTGYPKDLGPSRVIHFTFEREFVEILHQGHLVVVAFTIRGNLVKQLDKVLEDAAVEFYPHVKFMRVECPKYPGFCITRQRKEYPFIEIFHTPEQAANEGRGADPNITKYSVKVLPVWVFLGMAILPVDADIYEYLPAMSGYGYCYSEGWWMVDGGRVMMADDGWWIERDDKEMIWVWFGENGDDSGLVRIN